MRSTVLQSKRSPCLRPAVGQQAQPGYTLVEIMIATFLGLVTLTALVTLIMAYVRSRDRVEANMRLQEQWAKLQFLLDREIQESIPVTSNSSVNALCGAITPALSLESPGSRDRIVYYLSGTSLRRCGPSITGNGSLSTTVTDSLLLNNVSSFTVDTSTDVQRPSFTLTLTDPTGVTYTNQSQPTGTTYRARTIN